MAEEFDAYHKWLGIPPSEQPPNHYRLLGLTDYEADLDVIDAAANQRMSYVRECASGPHIELSQRILNHISSARLELLQPKTKDKYDAGLRHAEESGDEEEHDTAALGMVTDFPAPKQIRRRGRAKSTQPSEGITWHLPAYIVGASVLLIIGIFMASSVGDRLLASSTSFSLSRTSLTVPLEVRPQEQIESDPLEKVVAKAGKTPEPAPLPDGALGAGDTLPNAPGGSNAGLTPKGATPGVPSVPGSSSPPTPGSDASTTAAVVEKPIERVDLPNKESQKKSQAKLKTRFGKIAKKDEAFHASVLLGSLSLYDGDGSTQWVMIDQALSLTIKHDDYVNAMKAVDELAKRFNYKENETLELRVDAMSRIAAGIDLKHDMFQFFWDQSMIFIDRMIKNEQYELAVRVFRPYQKKAEDNPKAGRLRRDIVDRLPIIATADKYSKKIVQWKEWIQSEEEKNIAKGNKNLGLFYFCIKKDEKKGAEYLKKSGDDVLVKAATLAGSNPKGIDGLLERARAWRAAAKKLRRGEREFAVALSDRGRSAYIDAFARSRKEDRKKVEKELVKENLLIVNSLGMPLIYVPPGEFVMGSPETETGRESFGFKDEVIGQDFQISELEHRVRHTRGFYIGVYEVTQLEFEQIMTFNPSPKAGRRLPVSSVSGKDVREFIQRLSVKEQRQYALPTEAQWEYACRAGTTTAFAFGGRLEQTQARFSNQGNGPVDVGSFAPNKFGIYDMHGNVSEWVRDFFLEGFYAREAESVALNPAQLKSAMGLRIVRGGSYDNFSSFCRSAARALKNGRKAEPHIGFRVVLPAPR